MCSHSKKFLEPASSRAGFSLVELMVVCAMTSIVSLGIAQMMQNTARGIRGAEQRLGVTELSNELDLVLGSASACAASGLIDNMTLPANPNDPNDPFFTTKRKINTPSGRKLAGTDVEFDRKLNIDHVDIAPPSENGYEVANNDHFARIRVHYAPTGQNTQSHGLGAHAFFRDYYVALVSDPADPLKKVTGCFKAIEPNNVIPTGQCDPGQINVGIKAEAGAYKLDCQPAAPCDIGQQVVSVLSPKGEVTWGCSSPNTPDPERAPGLQVACRDKSCG
jgi:hypothetical protein